MGFWAGRRVCVTGGAGFVGSHLVEILVAAGAKVRVADNLERGKRDNLSAVAADIEFVQTDLRDGAQARTACKDMEVVMNMAARVTGIQYNREHHGEMFTANNLISTQVLEAARLESVQRFLCVSTACIYPHDATVPTPESEGDRGTPEPTNEGYGWAKRMAEKQAQYYAHEYGMEIAICRPFNAYGGRDYYDDKTSHVIPALVKKVLQGDNPVHVWGSGNQTRSFVHAKDFAQGVALVTEHYAKADPVNIGHDEEVTIRELIERICRLADVHPDVFYDTSKPEGYPRRSADTAKLKAVTGGFVPQVPLDEGLKEMIAWYHAGKASVR